MASPEITWQSSFSPWWTSQASSDLIDIFLTLEFLQYKFENGLKAVLKVNPSEPQADTAAPHFSQAPGLNLILKDNLSYSIHPLPVQI